MNDEPLPFTLIRDGHGRLVLRGADLTRLMVTLGVALGAVLLQAGRAAEAGGAQALSFAFPGPADYPNGIIGDLKNLPAFRGGVPLGPLLAETFGAPVFINNDGDLFAYGEAMAGLLPEVNGMLEAAGSPKRFRNLLGVTLGTGFGAGLVLETRPGRAATGARTRSRSTCARAARRTRSRCCSS